MDAECPGDKEDGNRRKCLGNIFTLDEKLITKKSGGWGGRATCLEHLNVGHTEIEIRGIAEDEACAKEKTDGEYGADKHVLRKMDILYTVEEVSCPLQDACTNSL